MSVGKKFESSGCEIQRWIEKGFSFTEYCLPQHSSCAHGSAFSFAIFVGFVGLGHKMVKLYIVAPEKTKETHIFPTFAAQILQPIIICKKLINKILMKRSIKSLLFSAALLLCCLTAGAVGTQPSTGDGSQANPYQIATSDNLVWFAEHVNSGNTTACAKLTADITVNAGVLDSNGNLNSGTFTSWTPIGGFNGGGNDYSGEFNGNGHTISGLYFNDGTKKNVGLFGKTASGAHIHDLGISDSYFCGKDHVGGICGDFAKGVIEYCYSTGTIYALNGDSGGLTGSCYTNAHIRQCHTSCAVTAGAGNYGGITGYLWGDVNHCCVMEGKNAEGHVFYGGKTDDAVFADNAAHSEAAFKSGEVCWLLNGSSSVDVTWHQKLGDGGDDYPVLAQCEGNTVYLVHKCDGSDTYSNTDHGTQAVHTPEYHPYTAPTETEDGNIEHWHCTTCGHNFEDEECTAEITGSVVLLHTTQLNNEIWYTSSTGQVVEPYSHGFGGCNIISNTYENGMGIIKFDNDVTSFGGANFLECSSLTSINIPASVTSIGGQVFFRCSSLTFLNIPASVTSIGRYAFYGCSSLTSINIPAAVTSIEGYAFCVCSSLTSVNIPAAVTSIGESAFHGCSSLTSIILNSNAIASGVSGTIYDIFFDSQVTQCIIGLSVTSIGTKFFYECSNLTSINIPSTVTSIGEWAFRGCSSLTSVTFDGWHCDNAIGIDAFYNVGSSVPVTLTLPIEWAGPRPDDNGNWYRGRFSTVKYLTEEERVLGEMGEPCTDCPAVDVTKGTTTIRLYSPEKVEFRKME